MGKSKLSRIGETINDYKDRKVSNKKLSNERRMVRMLVSRLGARLLAALDRDDEDEMYMTCSWFNNRFPNFPIILSAQGINDPVVGDFRRKANKRNTILSKWDDLIDAVGVDQATGIIFPYAAADRLGVHILHNAILPDIDDCTLMQRKRKGVSVFLDPIDEFAERVLYMWEPI